MGRFLLRTAVAAFLALAWHIDARQLRPALTGRKNAGPMAVASEESRMVKTEPNQLIHMLMGAGKPTMFYEEFLPQCLGHVEKILIMVDRSYTDEQLETVVSNECIHSKEFPNAVDTSFEKQSNCHKFAKKLAGARDIELRTGSKKGYEDFCAGYFVHRGGELPGAKKPKKAEQPKEKTEPGGVSISFIAISILACVAFVGIAYLVLRQ